MLNLLKTELSISRVWGHIAASDPKLALMHLVDFFESEVKKTARKNWAST